MGDKRNFLYNMLNIPFVFIFVRSILDGGQIGYLKKILKSYNIKSVLDIGCGCGLFCKITDQKYVGIDYNKHFISHCTKRYSDHDKKFLIMDALHMHLNDIFDIAILINVIHHFSDEEVINILRKARDYITRFIVIYDLIPQKNPISRFFYSIDRGSHIRVLEQQKYLISQAGLKIQDIFYHKTFPGIYYHSTLICQKSGN